MNLADGLRVSARRNPDATALIFQGRTISYGDLDDLTDRSAAAFGELGVRKGERVALIVGNVPEFVSSLYGILRAGGVVCPLNVQMTPEELGYILTDAGARVAVTEVATLPPVLAVRDRVAELETVLVIGGPPAPAGTVSLEEALRGAGEPPDVSTEPADLALIAYTSGTTASPKGAMLTHGNLTSNLDQLEAVPTLAARPDDVVLVVLPLFHSYALNTALNLAIRGGAAALLVDRFDPGETLDLIARHRVTVVVGAPPMYAAWLEAASAGHPADLSTVRLATSGAAALPADLFERFRAAFGVTICEGYGLTEAAPAVTASPGGGAKPGSIGPPLPGVEVRLVDADGDDADEDDPGEILVRGPNVFTGYWGRPEATAEAFDGEWLRTGDVAVRDDDGYLFLVDRKKDLIIVSGFNVYPREVEEAIARDPRVAEVTVVGVADERTGEAVQAWVVPAQGRSLSPEDVLDWLNGLLARFKWPKEVVVVDALPHHVTGKVLRRALREDPSRAAEVADE